jgi:hypothetical protein
MLKGVRSMRSGSFIGVLVCLSIGCALRGDDSPTPEGELKRLAGGGKECATWELQLAKDRKDQSLKRVTLTFHKTRLGASVTPIYVATLAADQIDGSVERGFSYALEVGPNGRFVVGSKGAVLAEKTRIPYTLEGEVLRFGAATARLPKVGEINLKGEWKKIAEK